MGDFQNSDKAGVIAIFIFARKLFKALNLKHKIVTILIFITVPFLPAILLAGLSKYIDYYTTNKKWRLVHVTIINKSTSHGRGSDTYLYNVKINDSTIMLSSKLNYPVDQVLYLKMCETNIGVIIADRFGNGSGSH